MTAQHIYGRYHVSPQIDVADVDGLKKELDSYTYPLHFIDFETSMVAIPFYKGRKPYEQTAFQFSGTEWVLVILAAFIIGLTKGGVKGVDMLSVNYFNWRYFF